MISARKPYEIAAKVCLEEIDYENFTEDMLADRAFIERHATLCKGRAHRCILVQASGSEDGVLVVPDGPFVLWAAAYCSQ